MRKTKVGVLIFSFFISKKRLSSIKNWCFNIILVRKDSHRFLQVIIDSQRQEEVLKDEKRSSQILKDKKRFYRFSKIKRGAKR